MEPRGRIRAGISAPLGRSQATAEEGSENVKILDPLQEEVVAEEGAVRGGFRVGWAPGASGG